MKAYTYVEKGCFELLDKPKPVMMDSKDAIVRVTLSSICSSDLHIKHGSVPRSMPGITVGHEMVGIVEQVGSDVKTVSPGDRVTVNVETYCGECFFCKKGYVNNCSDPNGGWALGCRIDGGQTEYVRVPYADQGLNRIPDNVTDTQASSERRAFVQQHYPAVTVIGPEDCLKFAHSLVRGGADVVIEVAGAEDTFELAWKSARPNAIVTVVALYDKPQLLPLPDMYGKNLTFKTGGVDGCDCAEILSLIEDGKIDTVPLITHRFPLSRIAEAYRLFENKEDGVIKVAIDCITE